jgi:hypothetical protein
MDNVSKIKITAGAHSIEIEGTETYVEAKLKDHESIDTWITRLGQNVPPVKVEPIIDPPKENKQIDEKQDKEKKRKGGKSLEVNKILPDLNLAAQGDIPSLVDFFAQKNPSSAMESNAVFVYYLKHLRKMELVGRDHIYTCYKTVEKRVPERLYQSLIDTRNTKGYIKTDNMNDLKISTIGENFVEKSLPKPIKTTR